VDKVESGEILDLVLPYGAESVHVRIPKANLVAVATPRELESHADPGNLVRRALREPIDAPPCSRLLGRKERLLILIDDITRPTPVKLILPILLEELQVELKAVEVTFLVALGTHRMMTQQEIEERVGTPIASKYPVKNDEWNNESALVDIGTTPNGTPIKVNRLVTDVDTCIGVGNIVPHNIAGWSGGGKILIPGICGKETTFRTHLLAARSPSTNLGKLVNPVRMEIDEVARRTKLKWVVNTVLDRDGGVAHVVAGEIRAAHRKGVELARSIWEVAVPVLADIVVVSSYPADLDFWQANKALYVAQRLVKRGGDIVLLTPCPEGLSAVREHVQVIKALAGVPSRALYHEAIRQGLHDYAALTVSDIAVRCRETAWVTVVSEGLTSEMVALLGFEREHTLEEALRGAFMRQGEQATVTFVTHGGETSPVVGGDQAGPNPQ